MFKNRTTDWFGHDADIDHVHGLVENAWASIIVALEEQVFAERGETRPSDRELGLDARADDDVNDEAFHRATLLVAMLQDVRLTDTRTLALLETALDDAAKALRQLRREIPRSYMQRREPLYRLLLDARSLEHRIQLEQAALASAEDLDRLTSIVVQARGTSGADGGRVPGPRAIAAQAIEYGLGPKHMARLDSIMQWDSHIFGGALIPPVWPNGQAPDQARRSDAKLDFYLALESPVNGDLYRSMRVVSKWKRLFTEARKADAATS